jgi:nucleotide-binding universal stress UspA family protein
MYQPFPERTVISSAREPESEDRAELIVVGDEDFGFVLRVLLGSIAEKALRQAPCDVLVVR